MRERTPAKALRCAIYTRVSSDSGLEQEFNSLDNQREAAEAYVKSQAHEGWRLLPGRYDDGGFSGGSMERPALQKLLGDIRARRIDIIVVYKVDRLTRSLADFAKLVELFDEHEVSFVSVTQAFNTTNSMGRLTLNVLLSFAQFEREVTGERIRDKIAASKKKGLWMGGTVPLGYRVESRKLLIEPREAATVRLIFERYLAVGSLPALQRDLRDRGIRTRERRQARGAITGGVFLTNGPLAHLLRNRTYVGEMNHKGQSYPGEHEAIVDRALFEVVQDMMSANRVQRRNARSSSDAMLAGKIFDDAGNAMSPTYAVKNGVRYRYYASCVLAQGRQEQAGSVPRVPAPDVEDAVRQALVQHIARNKAAATADASDLGLANTIERVTVRSAALEVVLAHDSSSVLDEPIRLPWSATRGLRKRQLITPSSAGDQPARPIRAEERAKLVAAIARARGWLDDLASGAVTNTAAIAVRERCAERSVRMSLALAWLSPKIVEAAVQGTLPRGVGLTRLMDLPASWTEQHALLEIASA